MCQLQIEYRRRVPLQKLHARMKPIRHRQSQEIKDPNPQQLQFLRVNQQSQCLKFRGLGETYLDATV